LSCLWYYFTYSLQSTNGWLDNIDNESPSTAEYFWYSVYYVTQTITKTGFGDLPPKTSIEFFLTIILTQVGALFYFSIFSKIDLRFKKDENQLQTIHMKRSLLREIWNQGGFFKGKKGIGIYKHMLFLIDEYRDFELAKESLPNFRDIRPQDLDTLILEICQMVHNFGEISFFEGLPKIVWLQFCEKMEKRVYLPGDMIYHEGGKATHFYVIKRGAV